MAVFYIIPPPHNKFYLCFVFVINLLFLYWLYGVVCFRAACPPEAWWLSQARDVGAVAAGCSETDPG